MILHKTTDNVNDFVLYENKLGNNFLTPVFATNTIVDSFRAWKRAERMYAGNERDMNTITPYPDRKRRSGLGGRFPATGWTMLRFSRGLCDVCVAKKQNVKLYTIAACTVAVL